VGGCSGGRLAASVLRHHIRHEDGNAGQG